MNEKFMVPPNRTEAYSELVHRVRGQTIPVPQEGPVSVSKLGLEELTGHFHYAVLGGGVGRVPREGRGGCLGHFHNPLTGSITGFHGPFMGSIRDTWLEDLVTAT
jgi:hypothetical protein